MNKGIIILSILLLISTISKSQETIDVTDQTIKLSPLKEEILYFGFAAGDKIIFNFEEIDKKELNEIEIIEYPSNSKFSDFKSKQVENKTIIVSNQSVYAFRFRNNALTGRICKIRIQRIPLNETTKNFNSTVTWVDKQETTYNTYTKDVIVGYDTTYTNRVVKEIVKTELSDEMIIDKNERIGAGLSISSNNSSYVQVNLPKNEISTYKTKKVKAWAYWIGVGKEATEAWAKNVNAFKNVANLFTGENPLTGLAIGTITDLVVPSMGEDVNYYLINDYANVQLFLAGNEFYLTEKGKGVAAFGKNSDRTQGSFYIGLHNDNIVLPIDANVKISIVWETITYADKTYIDTHVTPRYEKKTFSDPIVNTSRVPITGQ